VTNISAILKLIDSYFGHVSNISVIDRLNSLSSSLDKIFQCFYFSLYMEV